jgi:hypothetical protein
MIFALAAALCISSAATAVADVSVDFAELLHFDDVYRAVRHETVPQVLAKWGGYYSSLQVVELAATRNRYLVGIAAATGRQEVVVRGTANVVNALYDAEARMEWMPELGMRVHRGFASMARVIYQDLRPRLDGSRPLVLFGHSLGAAEAVLVGLLLERDGYPVRRVYGSGQPKITDAEGAARYAGFPVLRVSCELDPVPLLPPRLVALEHPYVHFGPEIILLDGPYYAESPVRREAEARAGSVWAVLKQTGARDAIRDHLIPNYLDKVRGKQSGAVEVPYADRLRYTGLEGAPPP